LASAVLPLARFLWAPMEELRTLTEWRPLVVDSVATCRRVGLVAAVTITAARAGKAFRLVVVVVNQDRLRV
jgi:hypothetical protein